MNSNEAPGLPPSDTPETIPTDDTQPPPFLPKLPTRRAGDDSTSRDPYFLLQWVLAQNPFYIASAIMLLYAMFRLSTDAKIFFEEVSQLFFNFGSFHVYEVMLAITAIVLVRRKILYDFSLLLCIESLFVFVPFILISQALLIEGAMALKFSVLGCLLVLLRFGQLRKYFTGMNFRPRLLGLGGVLLCVNVLLPLLVRYIHMGSNALNRDLRMNPLMELLWIFGAPLLACLAYFLPAPQRLGTHLVQRRTFPLTVLSLWVFVTCAHLYCIGYIHEVFWRQWYTVPVLWTAAWMFYLRLGDVFESPGAKVRNILLIPAAAATLLAARENQWTLFFLLSIFNSLAYGMIFLRQRTQFAFQLLSMSAAAVIAGVPDALLTGLGLDFHRSTCFGIGATALILLQTILSRDPKAAIFGGLVAAIASGVFFHDSRYGFDIAVQVGAAFLLIHSLRWDQHGAEARGVRLLGAGIWLLHSAIWTATGDSTSTWTTVCFALAVITVYFAVRLIFSIWGSHVVPFAAVLVLFTSPVGKALMLLRATPIGLLVLIVSFVLFALGTALALNRHRWQKPEPILTTETAGK